MYFFEKIILVLVLVWLSITAAFATEPAADDAIRPRGTVIEDAVKRGIKNDKEIPVIVAEANPQKKEGKTVWLEKKLSPSTRWLENAVKPITTWMERKIQKEIHGGEVRELPPAAPRVDSDDRPPVVDEDVIDSESIAELASKHIPGQILRIKLLNRTPLQYRVKLISRVGEIHILYINAHTGKIIQPLSKTARGS